MSQDTIRFFGARDLDGMPQLSRLPAEERRGLRAVAEVFPFRVNSHVVEELIDWDNLPNDPMFQLTFPQRGMLEREEFTRMDDLLRRGASASELRQAAWEIQQRHNPHPEGQLELNVPTLDGEAVRGLQHKYRETVLFFPAQGQTCHAYCTYCFRWAQFIGVGDLKFSSADPDELSRYLDSHPEVSDILFTGGDPMVMKTSTLRRYIEPLLTERFEHVTSIRIGTKAPAYWPYRFTRGEDADDLMRLFEEVRSAGRQLALMAHFSHPRELEHAATQAAIRRVQSAGGVIRTQAPVIRHVNDDANLWHRMWSIQVSLGVVPYYLFVERDTGPRNYFEVPLARCLEIFREAFRRISGLARTVRGPTMSTTGGKVVVEDVTSVAGEEVFVLRYLQCRDPERVGRTMFARYDPRACWFEDLRLIDTNSLGPVVLGPAAPIAS